MINVADETLAEACRAVLPDVRVHVGPTPEIDLVARMLRQELRSPNLEDLGIDATAFASLPDEAFVTLFAAARAFDAARPWDVVHAERPLRIDIPAVGAREACGIVLSGGDARGLVLFDSLATHDAFDRAVEELQKQGEALDGSPSPLPRVSWLSLDFVPADEAPREARALFEQRGWNVDELGFCPSVCAVDDGEPRMCTADEVLRIAAAARAVALACNAHGSTLARNEPLRVSIKRPGELEAEVDIPHPDAKPARAASPNIGRNDPCPCGSGKKYKKCHLGAAEPFVPSAAQTPERREVVA